MVQPTVVDALIARSNELLDFLRRSQEISLALDAELNFKKLLIMSCGSFFEEQISGTIEACAARGGDPRMAAFVRNKALKRQYHSLFDWDKKNVNSFLGLFGEEFKNTVGAKIQADPVLTAGVGAFLWIGQRRNQLAHGNIPVLPVDETQDEIAAKFRSAWSFVRFLAAEFGGRDAADTAAATGQAEAK